VGAIGTDNKTNIEAQTERYAKWMVQKT